MQWLIDRAQERSTWIGLVTMLSAFGVVLRPELQGAIVTGGAALGGLIACITADRPAA